MATTLCCDRCKQRTYPDWFRCIHCAHYFCTACHAAHACGIEFKCSEQIEAERAISGQLQILFPTGPYRKPTPV